MGVSPCIRDFLLDFEPYEEGNKLLWAFNRIRNSKIHRTLAPMVNAYAGAMLGGDGGIDSLELNVNHWSADGQELTYAYGEGLGENLNVQAAIDIAFADGTPLPGQPIVPTLNEIAGICSRIVTGIEAETARIMRG